MTSTSTDASTPARTAWLVPGALLAAVGGPVVLAVCNALVGFTPGQSDVDDTADLVRLVGDHPLLTQLIGVTGLLAAALIVPGVWAVAARLAPRTPWLAAIGGWAMATGYVFSVALAVDSLTALAVATAGGDPSTFADAMDQHLSVVTVAMYAVFGIGALGGGLVLGFAMLRQRDVVPAWAGWALVASEPVRVAGLLLGVPVGPPLASVLIAVAFGAVVVRTRRSR